MPRNTLAVPPTADYISQFLPKNSQNSKQILESQLRSQPSKLESTAPVA